MQVTPVAAPVRAQIVANLRHAILSGQFEPGERLVETQLCELLQVSRTSLREALRQLEAEKLVTITPYKGPVVTRMTVADAEQIYEVRALLEARAVEAFTDRAAARDLAQLRTALERFHEAILAGDALARLEHTDAFYDVILQGCGNQIIVEMLSGLHARINFLRFKSMSSPERSANSHAELLAILEAIESRSPERAAQAARHHVDRARVAAKKVLTP